MESSQPRSCSTDDVEISRESSGQLQTLFCYMLLRCCCCRVSRALDGLGQSEDTRGRKNGHASQAVKIAAQQISCIREGETSSERHVPFRPISLHRCSGRTGDRVEAVAGDLSLSGSMALAAEMLCLHCRT